ncbi:MAG: zinc-ribbon domain-containing protein [Candidatus Aramenus sp.]|nr:zinc-ribbon domain-containing protein [Candidatus Aramenus sp.]
MKYCPRCGYQNLDDAKFCARCGYQFPDTTQQSPPLSCPLSHLLSLRPPTRNNRRTADLLA